MLSVSSFPQIKFSEIFDAMFCSSVTTFCSPTVNLSIIAYKSGQQSGARATRLSSIMSPCLQQLSLTNGLDLSALPL